MLLSAWEGDAVTAWAKVWGVPVVEAYASIGSTSDRALELAAEGAAPFTTVVADEQTRGRGRRGADWHSPPGTGLWMSTVLPAGPARPWLPLLVGLATAQAIEDASEGGAVGIKWPNDLVLGGRKLAGVLCEASGSAVVAGIGVNVNEPEGGFPKPLATVATALDMEGFKLLSRSDLAGMILGALEARLGGARTVLDDATLAELSARDVLYGRAVESEERGRGTARGIAPDGSLMLERPNGSTVPVTSGSVRFRST